MPASLQDLLQECTKDLDPHTSENKTYHSPGAKRPLSLWMEENI